MTGPRFDLDYVRDSVAQSRARLKREQIDVMLLHLNDLPVEDAEPVFETLEELRHRGQVGACGWSTDFPDRVEAMASLPGFTTVQHAMNICLDSPAMGKCADGHNLTRLIRSPLAMGVLTGKFDSDHQVPHGDVRRDAPDLQGNFDDGCPSQLRQKQLDAVRDLITSDGRTLSQGHCVGCWPNHPTSCQFPAPRMPLRRKKTPGLWNLAR